MRTRFRHRLCGAVAVATASLSLLVSGGASAAHADGSHALIQGSGSSWAANAVNQWIADTTSSGLQVVYTSNGSSQGRTDYSSNVTDFSDSDVAYGQTVDPTSGQTDSSSRAYSYLPVVAGGTSFPYQVREGGQLVRNIRLSGMTIAKIFTNAITNWDDPEISADNNGRVLPNLPIIPIVRSDGSGATAQFTLYLNKQYPGIWQPYFGQAGGTSYWPRKDPQIAQSGSDQVVNFLTSSAANGAIAYDEYSYALQKNYPVISLENAAGYFTQPTQYNVAVALTQAQIDTTDVNNPSLYLTQILDGVYTYNDPRTYPLSSYSYFIIPTSPTDPTMTTAKRQTEADFLYYALCSGQSEAGPLGYSPLPYNLVQSSFSQVAKLKQADANVDLSTEDISSCNNPTFDKSNPSSNQLAEIAPQPLACAKAGAGPCADSNAVTANQNPVVAPNGKAVAPVTATKTTTTTSTKKTTTTAGAKPGGGGTTTSGTATAPGTTTSTVTAPGSAAAPGTAAEGGAASAGGATTTAATTVDPETGQVVAASTDTTSAAGDGSDSGDGSAAFPQPATLASAQSSGPTTVLIPLAILLLIAGLFGPPLIARKLGAGPR